MNKTPLGNDIQVRVSNLSRSFLEGGRKHSGLHDLLSEAAQRQTAENGNFGLWHI